MRYTRLKLKLLLWALLGSLAGGGLALAVLRMLAAGPLNGALQKLFLWVACSLFGQTRQGAMELYMDFFQRFRPALYAGAVLVVMLIAFYLAMGHFTRWLDQIQSSVHRIVAEPGQPVSLPAELEPMEQELDVIRRQLLRQREADRESKQRRQDLVSFLAHDLKTPLTSVVGYLTLLSEGPELSTAERSRYTGVALEKARRLEELLGEFFDISRMDLRARMGEPVPIRLSILLEQLTDEFYPIFREKQLECRAEIAPRLVVKGNPDRLARVFDNVLRNAVNYSSEGGRVDLQAVRAGEKIRISIRNEGLEIPEKELAHIFEKFYRLDAARSTRTGGAGLGLAIAREIVELHGGTIQAESNGRFTTFLITLPAADEPDTEP